MLNAIQKLLGLGPPPPSEEPSQGGFSRDARLAAVALLQRMVAADFESREDEQEAVQVAVGRLLGESPEEARQMLEEGRRHASEAVSLFDFTNVLHRQLDLQRKSEIVELLWTVAFADGEIDPQEEYLVRKVARLLHLPDQQFLAAKRRARNGTV